MNTKTCFALLLISLMFISCEKDSEKDNYDWKDYSLNDPVNLQSICMIDAVTGYIGGIPELGVAHLETKYDIGPYSWNPDSIFLKPENDEFHHRVDYESPMPDYASVYKTMDGGKTWEGIETPFVSGVKQLQFLDENYGFAVTQEEGVYKTSNGGQSWQNILGAMIYVYRGHYEINPFEALCFIDHNRGFAYDNSNRACNIVLSTTDGGDTWECINLVCPEITTGIYPETFDRFIEGITFPNSSDTGYLQTSEKIYRTIDKGKNWEVLYNQDKLLMTNDGGENWKNFNYNYSYNNPFVAVSENEFYTKNNHSMVYTIDNIHNETKLTLERDVLLMDLVFPTEDLGIAVGRDGTVLRYEK